MGLPDVSCAHTLVRMGGGGEEGDRTRADRLRAVFLASFLDAAALPPGMCRIRAPDTTAPPSGGRTVHQGKAVWLGAPDAELYRLDDTRWLLPSRRRAGKLARELLGPPITPPLAGATDDPRCARGGDDPAMAGAGGAGPSTGGRGSGQVRLHVVRDTPSAGHVSILQVGPVVARLQAVPGEGSALPDGLAADLGRLVARQISALDGAAVDLRRPAWHPARWRSRPDR
ncbi:hypothetical protein [Frankia sp. ACN1ag]|uniref:hypothetical protein n=1 Tax=Frankia sp. ACN1ag TaxID=102891 RepID=UPI0009F8292A|nr:hypothetical protein [Frankia sp. ACN1ag]